jgi:hypothetical protein
VFGIHVFKISNTFTILLLLGVMAKLFSALSIVASVEGLRIPDALVAFSIFDLSVLSSTAFVSINLIEGVFGATAGFSTSCVGGTCSFGSVAEDVSPPNSGTMAGSM